MVLVHFMDMNVFLDQIIVVSCRLLLDSQKQKLAENSDSANEGICLMDVQHFLKAHR